MEAWNRFPSGFREDEQNGQEEAFPCPGRLSEDEQNSQEEAFPCPGRLSERSRPPSLRSSSSVGPQFSHTARDSLHVSSSSRRCGGSPSSPSKGGLACPSSPPRSFLACLAPPEIPFLSSATSRSSSVTLPPVTCAAPSSSSFAVLGVAGERLVSLTERIVLLLLLSFSAASPHFFRHSLTTFQLFFSNDPTLKYSDFFHGLLLSLIELPAIPASLFAGMWSVGYDSRKSAPPSPASGAYLPPTVTTRVSPSDSRFCSSHSVPLISSPSSSFDALEAPRCQSHLPPSASSTPETASVPHYSPTLIGASSLSSRFATPLRGAASYSFSSVSPRLRCRGAARQLLLYAFLCWLGQVLFAISIALWSFLPAAGVSIVIAGAGGGGLVVLQRAAITALFPHAPTAAMAVSVACGALAKTVGRLGPALAVAAISAGFSFGMPSGHSLGQSDPLSERSIVRGNSSSMFADREHTRNVELEMGQEASGGNKEWSEYERPFTNYRAVLVAAVAFNGLSVLAAMGVTNVVKRLLRRIGQGEIEEDSKEKIMSPCNGCRDVGLRHTSGDGAQEPRSSLSKRSGNRGLDMPLLAGYGVKEEEGTASLSVNGPASLAPLGSPSWISIHPSTREEEKTSFGTFREPCSQLACRSMRRHHGESENSGMTQNNGDEAEKGPFGLGRNRLGDCGEDKMNTSFCSLHSLWTQQQVSASSVLWRRNGKRQSQETRQRDMRRKGRRRRNSAPPPTLPSADNQPEVENLVFFSAPENPQKPPVHVWRWTSERFASATSPSVSDSPALSQSPQTVSAHEVHPRRCGRPETCSPFSCAFLQGRRKRLGLAEQETLVPRGSLRGRHSSEAGVTEKRKERGQPAKGLPSKVQGAKATANKESGQEGTSREYAVFTRRRKENTDGASVHPGLQCNYIGSLENSEQGASGGVRGEVDERRKGNRSSRVGQEGTDWREKFFTGERDRVGLLSSRQAEPPRTDCCARLAAMLRRKNETASAKAKEVLQAVDQLYSWKFGALVILHAVVVAVGHCFLAFSSSIFFRVYKASMLHAAAFAALITVTTIVVLPAVAYLVDRTGGNLPLVAMGMLLIWLVLCGTIALQPSLGSGVSPSSTNATSPRKATIDSNSTLSLSSSLTSSPSVAWGLGLNHRAGAGNTAVRDGHNRFTGEISVGSSAFGQRSPRAQATEKERIAMRRPSELSLSFDHTSPPETSAARTIVEAPFLELAMAPSSPWEGSGAIKMSGRDPPGQVAGKELSTSQEQSADGDASPSPEVQEGQSSRLGGGTLSFPEHRTLEESLRMPQPVHPSSAALSSPISSFPSGDLDGPIKADKTFAFPASRRLDDGDPQEIPRQSRGGQVRIPLGVGGILRGGNNRDGQNGKKGSGDGEEGESVLHREADEEEEGRWAVLAALLLGLAEALLPTVLMALVADPEIVADPALYGVAFGVMEFFKCVAVAGVDATFGLIVDWQRGSYVGGLWFLCSLVLLAVVPLGTLLFVEKNNGRGEEARPAALTHMRGGGCHGAALLLRSFSPSTSPRHASSWGTS
ncbi:transmembrane protein [Cystoisospora suis]|uniref:Transmembrane protein n=1 Tax=Cystoisospora suis TaxID=483139 RepID=A0A2C6KMK5_9APIC|nr:transmembrane protein [Cystoisospora suis]